MQARETINEQRQKAGWKKIQGLISMMLEGRHTEIEGYDVHYWEGGNGFPVLFFHGVGPGTSIMGNFEPAMSPLADRYHIFATDLIGFGDSGRKSIEPYFDVDLWVRQGVEMLEVLPDGPCGVSGHSLGGAIALKVSAASDRVTHVLTSSTVGTSFPLTPALDAFWDLPKDREALREVMKNMMFDANTISDAMIEGRWKLFAQDGYAEYFDSMFGGDRQRYIDAAVVTDDEFAVLSNKKVSLIHGIEDKPCPAEETSIKLAERMPHASLELIKNCGHNLPREFTERYIAAAAEIFG